MRRTLLVPLLLGLLALVPAGPAAAAHPCVMGMDGRVQDPSTSSDHDGCGDYGSPSASVTEASDGSTVTVAVGQTVAVRLPSRSGEVWADVDAPPAGALYRLRSSVGEGGTTALFRAERASAGERLTATTDSLCAHGDPACAQPQRQWSVTVVVTDGPPTDRVLRCRTLPQPTQGTTAVSDDADGTTVRLRVGERLQVRLGTCVDGGGYALPRSTEGPLYRESATLQQAGSATATFVAARPGTATVTSTLDLPCLHRSPGCATIARVWSMTVEITQQQPVDEGCRPHTVTADRSSLRIGEAVLVTVRSPATSTVFTLDATSPDGSRFLGGRSESPGEDETITWTLRPTENTRLQLSHGVLCARDDLGVVSVVPQVSIAARRNAPRDYTFTGRVLPGRGQAVALYRVAADGRRVLTARSTVRPDGTYRIDRRFTGSGRFGFLVATAPGRTAAGVSPVRPTVVH